MKLNKRSRLGYSLLLTASAGVIIATAASCGKPYDSLDDLGNGANSSLQGQKNFAQLINSYPEGKVEPTPWAGYWWPYKESGIASGKATGGGSPAGKYDAARGRTTDTQSWEAKMHGPNVKGIQGWWGHCNGWCVAAALLPEPKEAVKVNGVTFDVADIKALVSEAGMSASAEYFGNRVWAWSRYGSPEYDDTSPDQYFLVLTNFIGAKKQAVNIDRYTLDQIWNQPLAGYKIEYPKPSDYLGADPSAPNVYRILVTSSIWWSNDGVPAGVITPPFNFQTNDGVYFDYRTLKMEVWLDGPVVFDGAGKIVSSGDVIVTRKGESMMGGAWRVGSGYYADAWPDYMWVPYSFVRPAELPDVDKQDNVNPGIDINWIREHILVPGGHDDTSVRPSPVPPPPTPSPSSTSTPTNRPTSEPDPFPTWTLFPRPRPTTAPPAPNPFPRPSPNS